MLYTHHSNHLEVLVERLAELLRQPLHSPFTREIIITQSNGLARWLQLRLADHLKISAHLDFKFPEPFIWDMVRRVLPALPQTSAFDPPVLRWRIMALLANLGSDAEFAALRGWLGADGDDFRRYELASHISDCLHQYLTYRPDWIHAWEQDTEAASDWQAALWRQLTANGPAHRGQMQRQLQAELHGKQAQAQLQKRLPERVALFGLAVLPPSYLSLFAELAHCMDVHLFLLNPCQEYWGDIYAERDLAHFSAEVDPEAEYLSIGHPLLASLGKQGRDFFDLLLCYPQIESSAFVTPHAKQALQHLQADMLHLRERGSSAYPPLLLEPQDRSLQIHICHSPMREVEVLHDQLLELFATQPDLHPSDVMIMAPDIACYGPLIEAVFGTAPSERRIPFSIADQGLPTENPLVEAFFTLLDLSGKRFDATQVLGLLEVPALSRRFALTESDVRRIRRWVHEVGIRWGINADVKDSWGLPVTAEHTWQAGMERLFLGYALPGSGRELYAGILPYDEIEGGEAQALGGLQSFLNALFSLHSGAAQSRTPEEWIPSISGWIEDFFAPREHEESQLQVLRDALEQLGATVQIAAFSEAVSLAVIKSALRELLTTPESGADRFLGGGVACCAMIPMRSIPFPVICLLGMNDAAYPRPQHPLSFNLLNTSFRRGDRSRRRDDRYLFLETLLSARRCFYISYVGQSIRDNTPLAPSVLVSELLEVLERSFIFRDPAHPSVASHFTSRHPLQPFSPRYFSGAGDCFSYAQEWLDASRQAGAGTADVPALLTSALPAPDVARRWLSLEELLQFLKHPTCWLLKERLGIKIDRGEEALAISEPFVPDALENYQLLNDMLELHREGQDALAIQALLRANGMLPHGQVGECVFSDSFERVARFAGRLGRVFPRRGLEALELDLTLGEFRLSGRICGMTPHGWVGYRMAKMKAADYLQLWVHHLAVNALNNEGVVRESYWVAEDQLVMLNAVENPLELLQDLLELYWQGMQRLLHFLPKSALQYAHTWCDKGDADLALGKARLVWEGSEQQTGERGAADYQLAFGSSDPLDAEFRDLAVRVFAPLFAHIQAAGE